MAKTKAGTAEFPYKVQNAEGISCSSPFPFLNYSYETLQCLIDAGYKYFVNGKETKFPTAAEYRAVMRKKG